MTGLLTATLNPNPVQPRGGGSIIVDDTALLPIVGPLGATASGINSLPLVGEIATYVVEKGDTLSDIAERFDVSVNTIRWANDINSRGVIRVGQELIILPVSGVKHIVKKGETLNSIAKRYGADAKEILNFNIIPADDILVGQELIIPGGEPPTLPAYRPISSGAVARSSSANYIAPISSGRLTQNIHGNNGVDLAAPTGTPVVSSCPGTSIIAKGTGYNGGYGLYIVITCSDGVQMLYSHLRGLAIGPGEAIAQGQTIGYVGSTGRSTGAHLHFEVRGARNFMAP